MARTQALSSKSTRTMRVSNVIMVSTKRGNLLCDFGQQLLRYCFARRLGDAFISPGAVHTHTEPKKKTKRKIGSGPDRQPVSN